MPLMYRPAGVTAFFRTVEEGEKAGYYRTFNAMAQAVNAAHQKGVTVDQPKQDAAPPAPVITPDDDRPKPPKPEGAAAVSVEDMPLAELRALASDYGLDTSLHHMTLRKQVREKIDAQGRTG